MINKIISNAKKYWKEILVVAIVFYFYRQNTEHFGQEGEIIKAGCSSDSPLQDYIDGMEGERDRTQSPPIVDINKNYGNIA